MTINVYIFVYVALTSGTLLCFANTAGGSTNKKGDGAPWGSYFSGGFGGFYSPDDFVPDPTPSRRLEHLRGRGHIGPSFGSPYGGYDDRRHGDVIQSEIPAVPDAQSRNVQHYNKQDWTQDTQQDMQLDWSQDTQQDFQDDTQQDFQDDTQQDFQADIQHSDPQDYVTGYPPAKGHHTTPVFHHTTYQPERAVKHPTHPPPIEPTTYPLSTHQPTYPTEPVYPTPFQTEHTTYPTEPSDQHTTNRPTEPYDQHTTYPTEPYDQHTTYPTEPTGQLTTYPTEPSRQHTTDYPTETTYGSFDTTKHPGLLEDQTTLHYPGPPDEGICQPNPAANGYPPGTKLLCTVEVIICDPITKSNHGGIKTTGQSTTLICKPYKGCDDTAVYPTTTDKTEYPTTTDKHDYPTTTDRSEYPTTTDKHEYPTTTDKPEYPTTTDKHEYPTTTDKPEYPTTTDKHEYPTTTDKPEYPTTTDKHEYPTDHPEYPTTTDKPEYPTTTDKPEYPTTTDKSEYPTTTSKHEYPTTDHPTTYKPVHPTEPPTQPAPTIPPTSPPCGNRSGVKGGSRDCGVKGVKGVKSGYHQRSWDDWASWNPWNEWESKREGLRKQPTQWLPRSQERRHESVRRPIWNGRWPSSFSLHGSAPVYADF